MVSNHLLNGMTLQVGETAGKQQENNHGHAMKKGGPRRSLRHTVWRLLERDWFFNWEEYRDSKKPRFEIISME